MSETTVYTAKRIHTMSDSQPEAQAVAVRDGIILEAGTLESLKPWLANSSHTIDDRFADKVIMPGFIDPHTHVVSGSAVDGITTNVGMTRFGTAAEVLDHLRSLVPDTPEGDWILARNFDPALQEGPDALTFAELDAVSTEVPVFVLNASGHLAYANRKAFAVAGISEDVADPPGAEFVRDGEGRLTGVMKNNVAFLQVLSAAPAMAQLDPSRRAVSEAIRASATDSSTSSPIPISSSRIASS